MSPADRSNGPDFVLGIDFGGTKVALGTANPSGRILARCRLATHAEEGASAVMRRTLTEARSLVAETGKAGGGRLVAAAAVTPGVVMGDRVELSPNLPGEESLALKRLLQEGLQIDHVGVANDVKAAGEAEARWGSLVDADPALFLNLGTGLSAAVIVGGRVVLGARGAAGEVAYTLHNTFDDLVAAQDEPRAPLEELIGGRALGERATRLFGAQMDAADLFGAAASDPRARLVVDEALSELALHLANWSVLLDPARVAVGGGLMHSAELILSVLRFKLGHLVPYPPEIVPAQFIQDGALRGAIALAVRTAAGTAAVREDLPAAG